MCLPLVYELYSEDVDLLVSVVMYSTVETAHFYRDGERNTI